MSIVFGFDLAAMQNWAILDRRGNWNEFAETIGVTPVTTTQTRTPNGVNEYEAIDPDGPGPQSPVALAHDANGNLTLDPTAQNLGDGEGGVPNPSGQVYEYDEENRLTAVRRASDNALLLSIAYDAVGRRITSADYLAASDPCGGPPALTRHVYAALETLEEHLSCDGGTNYALAREFIWGDRFPQPVALITHGGVSGGFGGQSVPAGESVYHYLHDVLGSVVALTNAAGQIVERYNYDPYGKTVIEQTDPGTGMPTARLDGSAFGNAFAWTGQRYDAGVRLYHFLYRGYSPHLGRWLQRDPLRRPIDSNLYEYVRSRPLRYVDVLGLQSTCPPQFPQSSNPYDPGYEHYPNPDYAEGKAPPGDSKGDIKGADSDDASLPGNPDLYGPEHNPTTDGETWNGLKNPLDALDAHEVLEAATQAANATGLPGAWGGARDAFRHCFASCQLSKRIGPSEAETFGTAHENSNPNPACPDDNKMDLHNNARGRQCAAAGQDCASCCTAALNNGTLRTLDDKCCLKNSSSSDAGPRR